MLNVMALYPDQQKNGAHPVPVPLICCYTYDNLYHITCI